MMNRIDGDSRSNHPESTNVVAANAGASVQAGTNSDAISHEQPLYDDWDLDTRYRDFIPNQHGPTAEDSVRRGETFSVWEAQSVSRSPAEFDADNAIVSKLRASIESGRLPTDEIATCGYSFKTALNQVIFNDASTNELVAASIDPGQLEQELRAELAQVEGLTDAQIDRAVDRIMSHSTDVIVSRVQINVQQRVDSMLGVAQDSAQAIADKPREMGAQLILQSGDQTEMTAALRELGLEEGEAAKIGEKLAHIAAEPRARQAFLEGTEGEAQWLTFGDSWKDVDVDLESALSGLADDVGNLRTRARNDNLKNSRILTSGLWEAPRKEAVAQMTEGMSPTETKAFRKIVEQAAADGRAADVLDERMKLAVDVLMTVGTGGLGAAAGIGMNMASGAVSINSAYADLDAAKVATGQGIAADGEVRKAEATLATTVAFAVLSTGAEAVGAAKSADDAVWATKDADDLAEVVIDESWKGPDMSGAGEAIYDSGETLVHEVTKVGIDRGVEATR